LSAICVSNPRYVKKETNTLCYFKRFKRPLSCFFCLDLFAGRLKNCGLQACSQMKSDGKTSILVVYFFVKHKV